MHSKVAKKTVGILTPYLSKMTPESIGMKRFGIPKLEYKRPYLLGVTPKPPSSFEDSIAYSREAGIS